MQGLKKAANEEPHQPGIVDAFVQQASPRGAKERRMRADPAIKGGLAGALAGGVGGSTLLPTKEDPVDDVADRIVGGIGGAMVGGGLGAGIGSLKGKHDVLQRRYDRGEPLESEDETDKLQEREIIGARGGGSQPKRQALTEGTRLLAEVAANR